MSYARRWVEFLISPKFSSAYVFAYSIITFVPPPTHAHIHVWYMWPCVCTSEYISVAPFPNPIPSLSMLHVLILRSLGGHVGRARVCVCECCYLNSSHSHESVQQISFSPTSSHSFLSLELLHRQLTLATTTTIIIRQHGDKLALVFQHCDVTRGRGRLAGEKSSHGPLCQPISLGELVM